MAKKTMLQRLPSKDIYIKSGEKGKEHNETVPSVALWTAKIGRTARSITATNRWISSDRRVFSKP